MLTSTIGAPLLIQATTTQAQEDWWSDEAQLNYSGEAVTVTTGAMVYQQVSQKMQAGVEAGLGFARSGAFRVFPNFAVPFSGQLAGAGGRRTEVKTKSAAIYTQAELHVSPQMDLVLGGRYTHDKRTGIDNSVVNAGSPNSLGSVPVDYRGHKFTYNLGVNYKVSRDKLVYAKYSTGFISGGQFSLAFLPEIAKSYEAGVKADWLDGTLRTNLALYRVRYKNIQGSVNGANLTPPQPLFTNAATNIGDARVSGFELETTYSPIRNLVFTGSTGLTDFKFTRIRPELLVGQADYMKIYRPRYTANVSAQYTSDPVYGDAEIVARIDGRWQSKSHGVTTVPLVNNATGFTAAEQFKYAHDSDIPSYWVWNARVALQDVAFGDHKGTIALWSRNLFNDKSPVFVQGLTTLVSSNFENARTIGVDVEFNF